MAKIIVSLGDEVIQELALTKERITIGRRPHNDVVIENLAISGEHAAIVTLANDSFLEDLNSTNGTLVNGQPIKKHFLQNGDVIALARYRIRFLGDGVQSAGAEPGMGEKSQAAEADIAGKQAKIVVLNGPNSGRELLISKELTTLGGAGGQVAVINRSPRGYSLAHVEGEALPSVNGKTVGKEPSRLQNGDVIELAGLQIQFTLQ